MSESPGAREHELARSITHVLYLGDKPGLSPFSGAENHVFVLLEALTKSGFDVELLVVIWHSGPRVDARLGELEQSGVKVTRVTRSWWRRFPLLRYPASLGAWWGLLRALFRRRDRLIHIHLDLVVAVAAAILVRCGRIVISVHNNEPVYRTVLWRIWFRIIDRAVGAYIAISRHLFGYLRECSGAAADKVFVVYYGVPAPSLPAMRRAELGLPEQSYVVGFVGRLTRQKNVGLLLSAAEALPDWFFAIVGDGDERRHLEHIARERGIRNTVFLGALPNAYRCMPAFDVFCLPSAWEGLGLVLVEAMLQRVPIVASRGGAIPEILDGGKLGVLFETAEEGSLISALKVAYSRRSDFAADADRIAANARERFSIATMVAQTGQVYEVVNRKARRFRSAASDGTGTAPNN